MSVTDTEDRKTLKAADLNALDDSDFAYIDSDGDRHLPIHDEAHVRAALARFNQTQFDTPADKTAAAKKIVAAAKKFDIEVSPDTPVGQAAGLKAEKSADDEDVTERADDVCSTCDGKGTIMQGHRKCPDCSGGSETKSARKPRHRAGIPAARETRLHSGAIEVRRFETDELEVRSGKSGNTIEVTGTPIVYNSPYSVTDMFGEFTETMAPGVAANVLSGQPDVRFLFNHDGLPLARSSSGTLEMRDSKDGLTITATLDSRQQLANDLAVAIERGDVSQMSCGFIVANDTWNDDMTSRTIYRFSDLLDVSAVTYPASPTTSISIAERMMREAPVESRARVRRMWAVSKELRNGRQLTPESASLMMDGLEVLATADDHVENALVPEDEERNAPTSQDAVVTKLITAAHQAVGAALAAQAKDPDNNKDPVDKQVWNALSVAQDAVTSAMKSQAKDGNPDAGDDSDNREQPPEGGADGTQAGGDPQMGPGNQDGTGSRSRSIDIDRDLVRLRVRKTAPLAVTPTA